MTDEELQKRFDEMCEKEGITSFQKKILTVYRLELRSRLSKVLKNKKVCDKIGDKNVALRAARVCFEAAGEMKDVADTCYYFLGDKPNG